MKITNEFRFKITNRVKKAVAYIKAHPAEAAAIAESAKQDRKFVTYDLNK